MWFIPYADPDKYSEHVGPFKIYSDRSDPVRGKLKVGIEGVLQIDHRICGPQQSQAEDFVAAGFLMPGSNSWPCSFPCCFWQSGRYPQAINHVDPRSGRVDLPAANGKKAHNKDIRPGNSFTGGTPRPWLAARRITRNASCGCPFGVALFLR